MDILVFEGVYTGFGSKKQCETEIHVIHPHNSLKTNPKQYQNVMLCQLQCKRRKQRHTYFLSMVQNAFVHQLRMLVEIQFFTTGLVHPRWFVSPNFFHQHTSVVTKKSLRKDRPTQIRILPRCLTPKAPAPRWAPDPSEKTPINDLYYKWVTEVITL